MDTGTAAGLALGAVADLALGDPRRGHPVAGFGRAAAALERRLWRDSRIAGAAHATTLVAGSAGLGWALHRAIRRRPVARAVVTGLATWTVVGGTSLAPRGTSASAGPPPGWTTPPISCPRG